MSWATVEDAVAAIGRGDFAIVVDGENRENEGDLIIAAERVTTEKIAFMVRHTSGLICLPVLGERLDELGLPLMVAENAGDEVTAFTVSIDAVHGTTTGISAADRATTIRAAVDSRTTPGDLARPGHVFPLRYRPGGVLVRPGHTEAAVDLARLAGLYPAGALAEIVNEDGTMARGQQLHSFAADHDIPLTTIDDLVRYRWGREALINREVETSIPTEFGQFKIIGFSTLIDDHEHVALVRGEVGGRHGVLTRIHSECLTGDVLGSLRCDCREQLRDSMAAIADKGEGVIVYTRGHEGRGIGLVGKLRAYRLQDQGRDTVEANIELGFAPDARHYGVAGQILHDLKVSSVRLMTNNPDKVQQLEDLGIDVIERVPHLANASDGTSAYLQTKARKLGHLLPDES